METSYRVHLLEVSKGLSRMRDQFASALYVLIGASGLLWLAVCASVARLFLARAEGKRRELAIRMATGATRGRLARRTLADTMLLAIPGSILALGLAQLLGPALMRILPKVLGLTPLYPTDPIMDLSMDHRMLLFAVALCALTIVLSAIGPAWRTMRVDINDNLKRDQQSVRKVNDWGADCRLAGRALRDAFIRRGPHDEDVLESSTPESWIRSGTHHRSRTESRRGRLLGATNAAVSSGDPRQSG